MRDRTALWPIKVPSRLKTCFCMSSFCQLLIKQTFPSFSLSFSLQPAAIEDLRKWTSSEALGDVTVTPDCMHHVDSSICTSMVIGDNGILTPALSPSVLSADAADALYALNISQTADSAHQHQQHHQQLHQQQQQLLLPNDINKDVPLNHRLPSPEEQTKIIALKWVYNRNNSIPIFQYCLQFDANCYSFTRTASTLGQPILLLFIC